MNFFISDIHLSDNETMKHDNRPFKNAKQYDKFTVKTWNKCMTKKDTIYVVGDLFDCNESSGEVWQNSLKLLKKIKTNIVLIIGNNEERIIERHFNNSFKMFKEFCLGLGIKDVKKDAYLSFGGHKFYLTHKPCNRKEKYINLVGHLHRSRGMWYSFGINVSCDLNNFIPLSEEDILYQIKEKEKYLTTDENFLFI